LSDQAANGFKLALALMEEMIITEIRIRISYSNDRQHHEIYPRRRSVTG